MMSFTLLLVLLCLVCVAQTLEPNPIKTGSLQASNPPHLQHTQTQAMDQSEHTSQNNNPTKMSKRLRNTLITTNAILMSLGYVGGSLISRLYFLHGGRRQWLSSFLETAGFPILLLPISLSYLHRRRQRQRRVFITPRILAACAALGLMTGADDFLYAYGLSFLPVSTSVLLLSTHLAFTAFFAFLIVRQKFTPYSLNAIGLLTVGAVMLGLHARSDRPAGVTTREYYMGFALTLGAALLYGLVLPLIELVYRKAKQEIRYALVMEMQLVMGFFATVFCCVGMLVNKDFQAIPVEAAHYDLGETKYYVVLIFNAILWQCFFLGIVGIIFSANTLLAAVITAVCIPVTEILGVIFYHENFSSEKGVALVLALWGLASYSYGEYLEDKGKKKAVQLSENV